MSAVGVRRITAVPTVAAFTVVALVWGTTPFSIKAGLNEGWDRDPLWFASIRLLLAALVISPVLLTRFSGKPLGRTGRVAVLPMGVFGIALNFGITVWGQQYVGAALASLIVGTQPVTTTLIARYATHRRITGRFALGLVFGLAGLAVVFGRDASGSGMALWGALAIFTGCSVYAAIFVYIGERIGGLNTVRVVAMQNLIGGALIGVAALLLEGTPTLPRSGHAFVALGYLVVVSSIIALVLVVRLIGIMGASRFSVMSFVTPFIGVTASVLWLAERLDLGIVLGAVLVAASLGLSLARDPPAESPPAAALADGVTAELTEPPDAPAVSAGRREGRARWPRRSPSSVAENAGGAGRR